MVQLIVVNVFFISEIINFVSICFSSLFFPVKNVQGSVIYPFLVTIISLEMGMRMRGIVKYKLDVYSAHSSARNQFLKKITNNSLSFKTIY